jgi:hypothetical protein
MKSSRQEIASSSATISDSASALLHDQQQDWLLLRGNLTALKSVQTRSIAVDDFVIRLQFNPARIVSSSAKVDAASIAQRKCFLCPANLPPEQRGLAFADHYLILCNPFPIFPEHFTIPHRDHRPQRIAAAFGEMLDLAQAMSPRYTVFYNGPRCGASAPDHLHFQAGDRGFMTIESEYARLKGDAIFRDRQVAVYAPQSLRPFISIESNDRAAIVAAFTAVCAELATLNPGDEEPMMNVLAWHDGGGWRVIVFPRAKHRPSFYSAEGDERILLSPASVDLGGVCIMPVEKDFHRLTADHLRQMLHEVMLPPDKFTRLRERLAKM